MLLLVAFASASPSTSSLLDAARFPDEATCGTELVRQVRDHWTEFSPAERAELDTLLAPRGLSLDPTASPPSGPPAPPSGAPTESCWDAQYGKTLEGDHFQVQYDEGVVTDTQAEDFLEAMEYSWQVEVDELGWHAPDGTDRYLMPVFIDPDYKSGAYTTVEQCGAWGYYPYILIGSNSFSDMNWTKSAAAHEFNHSIQFATSFAPEGWWWEATATYIEEAVYPSYNEWAPYIYGYTMSPEMRMNADGQSDYDEFMHMYGMAIWGFYLEEYQGGSDIVRQTWEAASHENGYYGFTMADMLGEIGIDFDAAYLDFMARNAVMDYREHRVYPEIDTVESVSSLPADGTSSSKHEPEGYGQNYIKIKAGSGVGKLQVDFDSGDGGDWALVLAEVDDTSLLRTATATAVDGLGSVTLDAVGDFDVYLVVSPTQDTKKGQSYSWSARIAEDVPDPEDTGNLTKDSEEDESTACGCSAANANSIALTNIASALALTMLWRRRRSTS